MVAVFAWKHWYNTDAIQVNRKQSPWKWLCISLNLAKFHFYISLTYIYVAFRCYEFNTICLGWFNRWFSQRWDANPDKYSAAPHWRVSTQEVCLSFYTDFTFESVFLHLSSERQTERHVFGSFCRFTRWGVDMTVNPFCWEPHAWFSDEESWASWDRLQPPPWPWQG